MDLMQYPWTPEELARLDELRRVYEWAGIWGSDDEDVICGEADWIHYGDGSPHALVAAILKRVSA